MLLSMTRLDSSCLFSGAAKIMIPGAATPTMLTVLPMVRKRVNLTIARLMGRSVVMMFFFVYRQVRVAMVMVIA